jgi:hypothetical protein
MSNVLTGRFRRTTRGWMACALLAAPLLAQSDTQSPERQTTRQRVRAAKAKIEAGDLVALRHKYFVERHKGPSEEFDIVAARSRAIATREQQRLREAAQIAHVGTVWAPIGPAPSTDGQTPQNFLQPSPVAGRTTDIMIDPVDNSVYVGAAQGGVWKTTDNGATWAPLTEGLASQATGALAMDPSNHLTIYWGTGEGNFSADSYAGVGIYKSIDGGANWTGPFGGTLFAARSVVSIAVDRTNSNRVVALTSSGICGVGAVLCGATVPNRGAFLSLDGGVTWNPATHPAGMALNIPGSIVLQDPLVATRWYAAMANLNTVSGGLWLSTDSGATWTSMNGVGGFPALNLPASGLNRYWITAGVDPAVPGQSVLFVGTGHNNASTARGGRIFRSLDSGTSWAELTAARDYCMGQCFYDMPIWTVANNPAILYHGGAGSVPTAGVTKSNFRKSVNALNATPANVTFADFFVSADNTTALHSDSHGIVTHPSDANQLWTTNDGGIWRSTDAGVNWSNRNTNLQITQHTGVDLLLTDAANRAYSGTQDNGTMGWTGAGVAWPHLDFGDGGYALFDQGAGGNNLVHTYFNQTNNLLGVGCTTGGFATTQGGYNGSFADTVQPNGIALADRVLFYAPIHMDRGTGAASETLYYGTHRLYRSVNFFSSVCNAAAQLPTHFVDIMNAVDLLGGAGSWSAIETKANGAPPANADTICVGSSTGRIFCTNNGTAGAPTWTERDAALTPKLFVSDVLIDPAVAWNPGTSGVAYQSRSGFFGSAGQNIRKTVDGGVTWAPAATGIPDIPVNAIALDPLVPNTVWAGTDVGVYVSTNGGTSWTIHGTGMPNVAVFDLKTSPLPVGQGAIIAATHGRGMYRLTPLTPVNLLGVEVE